MQHQHHDHPLAYVMARNGWSHRDLARVIAEEAAADQLNMSTARGKVWKWMNGATPDRVTQLLLARRLGVPAEHIDTMRWPLWLPAYAGIRTDFPHDHDGVLAAVTALEDDVMTDRRSFLLLTGTSMATLAGLGALPAGVLNDTTGDTHVDGQLVDDIEAGVPRLRRMEAKLGGASVQQLVDAELRTVISLLRHGSYTSAQGRRLYLVAAELARVAGWSMFDGQRHAAAQRYWAVGLYAARGAGDRLVAANILKSMSLQALDFGNATDALQVADATMSGLRGATPRVITMFTLRKARALAAMRDRAACERLIATTDADAATSHPGDPSWIGYFDQAEYHAQVGSCYLELGDLAAAQRWLAQALDLMPPDKTRDNITYLLRSAETHALAGDADAAATIALQAVPLMAAARSARNTGRLGELRKAIGPRHRAARDLDDALAA